MGEGKRLFSDPMMLLGFLLVVQTEVLLGLRWVPFDSTYSYQAGFFSLADWAVEFDFGVFSTQNAVIQKGRQVCPESGNSCCCLGPVPLNLSQKPTGSLTMSQGATTFLMATGGVVCGLYLQLWGLGYFLFLRQKYVVWLFKRQEIVIVSYDFSILCSRNIY